ncbi:MAG: CHAT domain-containing protein [Leptolyngbya sp. SIOISBB]|nr:CHAT domain-containing protein [Leptolyngbya sp. SIOISBB]
MAEIYMHLARLALVPLEMMVLRLEGGSTIDTGAGDIELIGIGQTGPDIGNNIGVFISGGTLRTTSGNIEIRGQGGNSNLTANSGVLTSDSTLITDTGSINITGTAGNGSSSSIGVAINPATTISTNSGIINLTGVGDRTSIGSQGSGAGIINDGINVRETSRIEALAGGEIRLNGTGGDVQDQFSDENNANTRGIRLGDDSEIFANNGNIFLTGRSQSNNNNVQGLTIAGLIQTTGSGNILLDGQGGTGEAGNNGVRIVGDALITAEDGNIQVNAISGNSVINNPSGFRFESGTIQTTGSGNIAINSEASTQISFDRIFRLDGIFSTQNPVQLSSPQDLILSDLTLSYPLSLQSTGGSVQIGSLDTQGFSFSSSALNSLAIGNISSQGTPNSGDVSLIAENNILLDSIQAQSDTGNGGNVLVRSNTGSVTVNGQISTFSTSAVGNGGSVRVEALTEIQTGFIDTSSLNGNAGDVLLDPIGDIEVAGINATAPNGTGGTVDITAGQFFRATESFIDFNGTDASISTAGASNGSVTIRHGGGITTPFIVGDGSLNGTQAAITTGIDNILPTSAFLGPYFQGDIQIITTPPQEPILAPPPDDDIFINDSEDLNASASSAEPVFLTVTYEDEDVIESILNAVDETFQQQYEDYFQSSLEQTSVESSSEEDSILINAQNTIRRIESATGAKPAIVYAFFAPSDKFLSENPLDGDISEGMSQPTTQPAEVIWAFNSEAPFAQLLAQLQYQEGCEGREEDQLFLILVTSSEEVISKHVPSATCAEVIDTAREFRVGIYEQSRSYLSSSQKLHAWLIQPLIPHLEENDINNLAFIMDQGLRATPLAALHNGQEFLIEDYSLGLLPSLNITDTRYQNVQESFVLPAGISDFSDQNLANLPAVPFEITSVTENWFGNGDPLLDESATQNNLRNARSETAYAIVHLATHASFVQGDPSKSFIQLWDQKLRLSDVRTMGWHDPVVELLILSACETASDSYDAELGFAGFASQAGVKSTVASLWAVSDIGTAGLMAEFYTQLRTADIPVKAEAVRQTQLAMLNGEVQFESEVLLSNGGRTSLPEDLQAILADNQLPDLSHPFYWSGFTLVGSPW